MRVTKLLRVFPAFGVMLQSMTASLASLFWILLFLGIVIYGAGVACVFLIGSQDSGYPAFDDSEEALHQQVLETFNNYMYFGTLRRAGITLFNLAFLNEVSTVLRGTAASQPWAAFFLVVFIMVVSLCILNTIIGVIVDKTVAAALIDKQCILRQKRLQMRAIQRLADTMCELDDDGNSVLSLDELRKGSGNQRLQCLLRQIDLPAGFTAEELFAMLDIDSSTVISYDEFVGGMFRLLFSNGFQRECLARLGESNVKQVILRAKEEIIGEVRKENNKLLNEVRRQLVSLAAISGSDAFPAYRPAEVCAKFTSQDDDVTVPPEEANSVQHALNAAVLTKVLSKEFSMLGEEVVHDELCVHDELGIQGLNHSPGAFFPLPLHEREEMDDTPYTIPASLWPKSMPPYGRMNTPMCLRQDTVTTEAGARHLTDNTSSIQL